MQGQWISKPNNTACLVFIHGILSDWTTCWTHAGGAHWPSLTAADPAFADIAVYNFTFRTGILSGDYGIGDAADSLKELAKLDGVFEFQTIVFVCHSLGGIVARKLVVDNAIHLRGKKVGFFLLGSPSRGSSLANVIAPLARMFKHEQAAALLLVAGNSSLADLDKNFRNLIAGNSLKVFGKELVEDKALTWLLGRIVDPDSAALYFADSYKVPQSDHSSISKPEGLSAIQHRLLRQFVQSHASQPVAAQANRQIAVSQAANPLFEMYSAVDAEYYLDRAVDKDIFPLLARGSAWISGPSGTGKTSLIRRWLDVQKINHLEITLTTQAGDRNLALKEIADTLAIRFAMATDANPSLSRVIDLLLRCAGSEPFVLFLDEMRIEQQSQELIKFATDLLDSMRRRSTQVKLIACSINTPVGTLNNQKFFDFYASKRLENWNDDDLSALVKLIATASPKLGLSDVDGSRLVREANGSPRFIKTVLRDLEFFGESRELQRLIDAANEQLRG